MRADFPAAICLAEECPNLGRDSISCRQKNGQGFANSIEICRNSEKHRACEPRNLTHELSHESAHENAHESVDSHESAHGKFSSAHGKFSSAHEKFSNAHENVHESELGQFSHVLFSHVLFLGQEQTFRQGISDSHSLFVFDTLDCASGPLY